MEQGDQSPNDIVQRMHGLVPWHLCWGGAVGGGRIQGDLDVHKVQR